MDKKYTALLLDADNTLLDFTKDEQLALTRVMNEYGVPVTEENRKEYMRINTSLWKALERGEITKPELKKTRFRLFFDSIGFETEADALEVNERYLSLLGEGGKLLEGAIDVCRSLKQEGYSLYIVTNGVANTQKSRLKRSGLLPYIDEVFISEALGYQKPLREFFDIVLDKIPEKDKKKIIVVGDSLTSDIRGAMNAGLDSIWLCPENKQCPEEYTPKHIIRDIRELPEKIR